MDEVDERISAWETIAKHPFFEKAYAEERPLIVAMMSALDRAMVKTEPVATQAELPVQYRVQRAFTNGYVEGVRRGADGRFDH